MNILEYANITITFPFAKGNDANSKYIFRKTFEAILKWDKNQILINFYNDYQNNMYLIGIDKLLVETFHDKDLNFLDYPTIELEYRGEKVKPPEMSIVTLFKDIRMIMKSKDDSFLGMKSCLQSNYSNPPCSLDKLVISIEGNLEYFDMDRPHKVFDIRNV